MLVLNDTPLKWHRGTRNLKRNLKKILNYMKIIYQKQFIRICGMQWSSA